MPEAPVTADRLRELEAELGRLQQAAVTPALCAEIAALGDPAVIRDRLRDHTNCIRQALADWWTARLDAEEAAG